MLRRFHTTLVALLISATACGSHGGAPAADSTDQRRDPGVLTTAPDSAGAASIRDWSAIAAHDTLRVVAPYNSTSYFIYKGEPMGYEYELLRAFAKDHHLALKLMVVQQRDSIIDMVRRGLSDVAAARLVPMPEDSGRVAFATPLYHTDPVLVQRHAPPAVAAAKLPRPADTVLRPGPAERGGAPTGSAQSLTVHARLVQRPEELAGQRVTLPHGSPYRHTLIELSDTTGNITVVEVDSSSEALIRGVAQGAVDYTVTEGNLAQLQGSLFQNLTIRPVLGAAKPVAWAVNRRAKALRDSLDAWIADERSRATLDALYRKYFVDRRRYGERITSRYLTSTTGTLSPYDTLMQGAAPRIGWDWRLLAAQMYQESEFNPRARSWAGAQGLLQLMPATARQFGARQAYDPRQNVQAAVNFLKALDARWQSNVSDSVERLRFVLASYNAGSGHIEDAQRLTEAHGGNPKRWADVSYWVLQLSKAEVYTQPQVKFGFCRGLEPVMYVSSILDRFNNYRQFVRPRSVARAIEHAPARITTRGAMLPVAPLLAARTDFDRPRGPRRAARRNPRV